MSRDNIRLVLRATEAVYRRPKPDFETINELFHADHVLVSAWTTAFGEAEATGALGFKRWFEETARAMPWDGRIDGAVDVGPKTVLLAATLMVEGASSGVEGEIRIWCVHQIRRGKIVRTETYTSPHEALESALAAGTRDTS